MPSLHLKIDLDPAGRIGPGKIELLERIAEQGSISGGARAMKMSYKRAWDLVEEMNTIFGRPVVSPQPGGRNGGGSELTELGKALVSHFRSIEQAATEAARADMQALQSVIDGS